MKKYTSVEEYIESDPKWRAELDVLRGILLKTEFTETLKWSMPTYCIQGKNVLSIGAFKHHFCLWFHQGVFLKDEDRVLMNAQDGKTKAMRQWRFSSIDDLNKPLILKYAMEAIENQKLGKEITPVRSNKKVIIPKELENVLNTKTGAKTMFTSFPPSKQREYCDYISSAKREATKQSRLEKITPMILEGVGLNDKYKNC